MEYLFYQIVHILPIAIAIAAIFASFILVRKMQQQNVLIALLSSGVSLFSTIAPIIIISIFLSITNFYIASELATEAKKKVEEIILSIVSATPIKAMEKEQTLPEPKFLFRRATRDDPWSHYLFAVATRKSYMLLLGDIQERPGELRGKNMQVICYQKIPSGFAPLVLENHQSFSVIDYAYLKMLQKKQAVRRPNSSPLAYLLQNHPQQQVVFYELARRISMGLFPFVLTLLGLASGFHLNKNRAKWPFFIMLFITAALFTSYMFGKATKLPLIASITCFILPHLVATYYSCWLLRTTAGGK